MEHDLDLPLKESRVQARLVQALVLWGSHHGPPSSSPPTPPAARGRRRSDDVPWYRCVSRRHCRIVSRCELIDLVQLICHSIAAVI